MAEITLRQFTDGWVPDADPTNGPPNALLRADNLTWDEQGVVSLRAGCAKINGTPFADLDVHSLFTAVLNGTRYRYAGAAANVYRNAVSLGLVFDGSGDIVFGSYLGQVFMARGTVKRKDDGSTVRNWGIAMTGSAPTAASSASQDSKEFATFASGETTHTIEEDNGAGVAYANDQDGAANQAISLIPKAATGRGVVTRTLAAPTDFNVLAMGRIAQDDDLVTAWFFVENAFTAKRVVMQIDVNDGTFLRDYYYKFWDVVSGNLVDPHPPEGTEPPPEPPII